MKILQIAPQIPFPLSDGGKVGIYNITKHLAERGHDITLLCFDRDVKINTSQLEKYCELIAIPHSTKNTFFGGVVNLFSEIPYNISKYYSQNFIYTLEEVIKKKQFDIVHVDHLHMAHYGLLCKNKYQLPIVLREHNIESTIVERYFKMSKNVLWRKYLSLQLKRIREYESNHAKQFDICAVITPDDQTRLHSMQFDVRTAIVSGGVEESYFNNNSVQTPKAFTMTFFGGFDWLPNQDALQWFLLEVMPLIVKLQPNAQLFVIGKKVPERFKQFESKNVVFKGFVEDLKHEIQNCEVSIAPFRIGGGIRLKILESFAMGIPVVSTSVGCEGIECIHGRDILIADTANEFADNIVHLFGNNKLKKYLTSNAFSLAKDKYSWEKIAEQFEKIYLKVITK